MNTQTQIENIQLHSTPNQILFPDSFALHLLFVSSICGLIRSLTSRSDLLGEGWKLKRSRVETLIQKYRDQQKTGDQTEYDRFFDSQCSELRAQIGIQGSVEQEPQHLDFSNGKDYCAAKTLYISDSGR